MKTCDKIPYPSKEDAIRHLHKIQNISTSGKVPVRAYQCNLCKRWHLTSKEILTDDAKTVKLKHSDQWSKLLQRQENREHLYGEKPFETQIEKAIAKITHNINIQCEVLDEKFRCRSERFINHFNRDCKSLEKRLKLITGKYKVPQIKVFPKSEPSVLDIEMNQWVNKLSEKKEISIDEANLILSYYIKA